MADKKQRVDWEAVERDYRAGILSVREIARQNGCTEGAVRKKAKADGWERDLSEQVQQTVRSKLVRSEVRTASTREAVQHAADTVVALVRQHRVSLAQDNERLAVLSDKLGNLMGDVADLDDLQTAQQIAESIARTRHKLIALERQAFNVDGHGHGAAGNPLASKTDDELEAAIAVSRARSEGRKG